MSKMEKKKRNKNLNQTNGRIVDRHTRHLGDSVVNARERHFKIGNCTIRQERERERGQQQPQMQWRNGAQKQNKTQQNNRIPHRANVQMPFFFKLVHTKPKVAIFVK